jgi:phthalate 4,5-cis-dihydrodiol dehydrogenase
MAVNIGIIGAGFFGAKHAEAIAALPNGRVVAANRTNLTALEAFVSRYGGRAYTRYEDVLSDPEVDAVVVATPHHLHTEIVLNAARAGKHIMLEKPIALDLQECDQIAQAVRKHGIKFMAGHTNHFVSLYQQAKEIVESGELGELVLGVDKTAKLWLASNRRDWHLDRNTGGGMWMTIGVHNIDRLTWFAQSRVMSVSAHLDTRFHQQQADDVGAAFLRYQSGFTALVYVVGYRSGVSSFEIELVGTKGILKVDKLKGLSIGRDETWQHIPAKEGIGADTWMDEALINQWQAFLDCIESDSESPVTVAFARHIMAVIFAAEESSRQQKEVSVG